MFGGLLIGMEGWYSTRCRLIWKLKGTKSFRLWFQLAPSMLPIEETGFGLLPTPTTQEPESKCELTENGRWVRTSDNTGTEFGAKLNDVARLLPTPKARDEKNGSKMEDGRTQRKLEKGWTIDLNDMAAMKLLPTPTTTDYKGGATAESYEARGRDESNDLRTWAAFQERTGKTSQLNHQFVCEMMGFQANYLDLW
jgi:hypothetical protein